MTSAQPLIKPLSSYETLLDLVGYHVSFLALVEDKADANNRFVRRVSSELIKGKFDTLEVLANRDLNQQDDFLVLRINSTSPVTLSIPVNTTGTFRKGFSCFLWTENTGNLELSVANAMTTTLLAQNTFLSQQYSLALLINLNGAELWGLINLTGGGSTGQTLDGTVATATWDTTKGENAEIVWQGDPGNRTIQIINIKPGTYSLTVKQNSVGGKTTILTSSTHTIKWSRLLAPPWTLSAYGIDVITFVVPPSNTELLGGFLEDFGEITP